MVDIDLNTTCVHSNLPLIMKETHAFEYNDTLLVCTSFTLDGLICFQHINFEEMVFVCNYLKNLGFINHVEQTDIT